MLGMAKAAVLWHCYFLVTLFRPSWTRPHSDETVGQDLVCRNSAGTILCSDGRTRLDFSDAISTDIITRQHKLHGDNLILLFSFGGHDMLWTRFDVCTTKFIHLLVTR